MRKLMPRWLGWPFRRQREQTLIETDPTLPVEAIAPAQLETRGCAWAAGASDQGRNRPNNEDDFLLSPERCLFIVCDGMGGHAAGEVASGEAIEALDELLPAESLARALAAGDESVESLLREALQQANERMVALGQKNSSWAGMASTAVIGVLHGTRLHVSNLGDSRAYRVRGFDFAQPGPTPSSVEGRGDQITLLTRDHSVAAALVDQGQLTPEQARMHPLRNHLTASLGIPQPVTPAYTCVAVQPGDRIVLCSDGLWDMLSDAEIAHLSIGHPDPHEAVKALISAANAAGGLDNITVIVVAVGAEKPAGDEQALAATLVEAAEPALATEPCMSGQPAPSPPPQGAAQ